jgi:hypothetical protein
MRSLIIKKVNNSKHKAKMSSRSIANNTTKSKIMKNSKPRKENYKVKTSQETIRATTISKKKTININSIMPITDSHEIKMLVLYS